MSRCRFPPLLPFPSTGDADAAGDRERRNDRHLSFPQCFLSRKAAAVLPLNKEEPARNSERGRERKKMISFLSQRKDFSRLHLCSHLFMDLFPSLTLSLSSRIEYNVDSLLLHPPPDSGSRHHMQPMSLSLSDSMRGNPRGKTGSGEKPLGSDS